MRLDHVSHDCREKGSSSFTFLKDTTKENRLVGQLKLGNMNNILCHG